MKNSYVSKLAALLCLRNVFVSVCLSYLRVGHTHEDVDRWFATIWCYLLVLRSWQTPDDIVVYLGRKLCERFGVPGGF